MRSTSVVSTEEVMIAFLFLVSSEDEIFQSILFGRRREPEDGRSYLVKEKKPDGAMSHFLRIVKKGHSGLVITRQHPNNVVRKFNLGDIRLIWLSTSLGKDYVDPHNLNVLTGAINAFLQQNGHGVVLLDGLEYLILHNDFGRVLKFVEYINELVMQRQAVLLISLDERAFEARQVALLERNATVLEVVT